MQLLLQRLQNGSAREHSSQPDTRAEVSDMSVALLCLASTSHHSNEAEVLSPVLFFTHLTGASLRGLNLTQKFHQI
jgi:hypothetical protein